MSIYEELGVRPLINANATLTRLGGSLMPPEVMAAMEEASRHWVDLEDLQYRIGEELARLTHNEAAYVATGAAAGIALAVSACVTRDDPKWRDRLPDTTGMKNEVIVYKTHRNGYDFAARMVGVRMVDVGTSAGATASELEAELSDKTACILWFQGVMTGQGEPSLAETIAIADAHGIPVLVDAAAQLPPAENLWRFTQMGATAAIFSGGKDLCGPQTTGLIVGRKWLIEMLPPLGSPNAGLARPMKVGKEEMAGLLAAVRRYLTIPYEERVARDERVVEDWRTALAAIPGVTVTRSWPSEAGQPMPRAQVRINATIFGFDASEVARRLWDGDPRIAVAVADDSLFLNPMTVTDQEAIIVAQCLASILTRLSHSALQ